MFQEQIDRAIAEFTRLSIGEQPSIMFKDIERCPLPESLRKFFAIEADAWMAEEKKRLLDAQHFSYADPEILQHLEGLVLKARGNACFQREEFLSVLRTSITLLFNYVCRPQYTLSSYLFADAEHLHIDDLLNRMGHFTDYDYYLAVLSEYTALKDLRNLERGRFEELLAMIDHEVVRHLDSRSLAHLSTPIFALFQYGEDADFARVPLDALAIFFDDKDLGTIVERLEREKQVTSSASMHELVMLLGDVDFSTGLDIRSIVSRQFGATDAAAAPAAAALSLAIPAPERDLDAQLDALDVSLADDDRTVAAAPVSVEAAREEAAAEEREELAEEPDEPFGGEHVTPSFGLDDTLDEPALSHPRGDDVTIPPVYIVDTASDPVHRDVSSSLEVTIDDGARTASIAGDADSLSDTLQDAARTDEEQIDTVLGDTVWTGAALSDTARDDDARDGDERYDNARDGDGAEDAASSETVAMDVPVQNIAPSHAPPQDAMFQALPEAAPDRDAPDRDALDSDALHPLEERATPAAAFPDLRSLIPQKDKKRFIKKLFHRDEAAYERAIEALNARTAWQEASPFIDELFIEHRVDLYSRIAVEFSDMIFSRYNPKK